jgi:hypothetical protein
MKGLIFISILTMAYNKVVFAENSINGKNQSEQSNLDGLTLRAHQNADKLMKAISKEIKRVKEGGKSESHEDEIATYCYRFVKSITDRNNALKKVDKVMVQLKAECSSIQREIHEKDGIELENSLLNLKLFAQADDYILNVDEFSQKVHEFSKLVDERGRLIKERSNLVGSDCTVLRNLTGFLLSS